jgi:hypothetical protein
MTRGTVAGDDCGVIIIITIVTYSVVIGGGRCVFIMAV